MAAPQGCPSPHLLEQFVLGLVDNGVAVAVEDHLHSCDRCSQRMPSLTSDDSLVLALRECLGVDQAAFDEHARAQVPLYKCLQARDITVSDPDDGPDVPTVNAQYSFLAPSSSPEDLGSLGGYRILEVLGVGGMGIVFRAHDERLNRDLAVKVIKPGLYSQPDSVERFLQEARAVASVAHENIVPVYQADEQQGVPFLAMPLLRGETLESRLQHHPQPMPLEMLLHIGLETARGLAAAHALGLIHRDIKPANLWLENRGEPSEGIRVKILDFGLAEVLDSTPEGDRPLAGTPGYMAPEQIRGERVDHRADLFSLGVVLYRLATGVLPFSGRTTLERCHSTLCDQPVPALRRNPQIPERLNRFIARLLAKTPSERPASTTEVIAELEALIQWLGTLRLPWWSRRKVALAGLGGLVLGFVLWSRLGGGQQPEPPRPGRVTFDFPEAEPRLELIRGDTVQEIDLTRERTLTLEPGDYFIRPQGNTKRKIRPERFTVKPGESLKLVLALTGEINQHQQHGGSVTALAVVESRDRLLVLSSGTDRRVFEWAVRPEGRPEPFTPRYLINANRLPFPPLLCLAVSPAGDRVAFSGGDLDQPNDSVFVWDIAQRSALFTLNSGRALTRALTFDDTGKFFLAADSSGFINVWELSTRKSLIGYAQPVPARRNLGVNHLAFDPQGDRVLAACGDGSVQVLRFGFGLGLLKDLPDAHPEGVDAVVFLPNRRDFLSAGRDGVIRLWDSQKYTAQEFKGHAQGVRCLAVSSDGSRLLSGDAGGQIRLWSIATGETLFVLEGHRGKVNAVALMADGTQAVSGGEDRTVRFWQLPR